MSKVYRPYFPEQDLLLPPSLREWLNEDHLAYLVSDLVDQLDLGAIERHYERKQAGQAVHEVLADSGYCSEENLRKAGKNNIDL